MTVSKSNAKVGMIVTVKATEDMQAPFKGRIEKVYENAALLTITDYDARDELNVKALHDKIVVSLKQLKKVS
ncbi:DUF2187 domain-containing protein [Loigolactobacillus coryniformis]|uniref:DUF2187 domain-containing protein n=1 Tax=Loigolactobacillus coryniformis TaxID=1610 RepID=A0A5B8TEC5_9LACO|nr:DUF2187 domain-containing protein [Loigolactobacillus coryniformis]OEH90001.1 hypothetical protein ATO00_07485 [Loigolactobacillus coryniformis subsp. coryniformis]RRG05393.1 MAG: DUF2187 domain-containing protein [Lactobacillus sp.]ATO54527.1 DUF2187 domain-containing protein [Loigolactobacillus coryniformis subsp. coryniformis KCTC 3167 = DSM 20001]MBW4801598.1 DUF2187 domain-containing protein [Loigolactobacillus coryniformis subsp. torquens]MBW4804298.1 DUF2187 domain-containing protein